MTLRAHKLAPRKFTGGGRGREGEFGSVNLVVPPKDSESLPDPLCPTSFAACKTQTHDMWQNHYE